MILNWLRSRFQKSTTRPLAPKPRTRLCLQQLEDRDVPSADFLSALGISANAASLLPYDNTVDGAGNCYVAGILYGTTDFDPGTVRADGSDILTPRGTSDAYIAKYAPDNSLLWTKRMGGDFVFVASMDPFDRVRDIALDSTGNVYVSGTFAQQADFGPITLTSAGHEDAFLTKLDSNGNFLWAKRWGDNTFDMVGGASVDPSGNVIQVGFTTTPWGTAGWIADGLEVRKFSSTGSALWTKRVGNLGGSATGVASDALGNVFIGGSFSGTVDFDPDPKKTNHMTGSSKVSSGEGVNAYILKLTSSGSFGWVSPFVAKTAETSDAYIYLSDMAVDPNGNIVAGGSYRGQVDINPSSSIDHRLPYTYPTSGSAPSNGVMVKLSPSGSLLWANSSEGGPVTSIAIDRFGSIYATGFFTTSCFTPAPGQPSISKIGSSNGYVTKLNPNGTLDWSITFAGTSSSVHPNGIGVDANGTVYVVELFSKTVDFDPNAGVNKLTATGYSMFLLKLTQS